MARFGDAWGYLLAAVAGAALSLSFAPLGWWPIAVVAPAVLIALWDGATPRRAAWLGFCFNVGTFSVGTYWLYISIAGFGQAPAWLAIILMAGISAIMGSYHAALGYAVARWLPPRGLWRWLAAVPAAWLLVEWLRGWLLSGFGWLAVGYSQSDTWLASLAPVGGIYLVSLAVLVSAGALVAVARADGRSRWIAMVTVALPWAAGLALARVVWTEPAGAPLQVAVVQGAIPQDMKWLAENLPTTLARYRDLTRSIDSADLIVWPESAAPDLANNLVQYLSGVARDARARGAGFITGVVRASDDGQQYFNSVLALDRDIGWYDKHHLVPFAEFFPVPSFVRRWLRLMSLPYSDFTRGAAQQAPLEVAGQKIAASICYEDAYGSTQLPVMREATLLVNVTNDAWFGRSTARYQHLQIARFRALETGRYMIRAANDGVSAVIGPRGELVARAPEYVPVVLEAEVLPLRGLTPYARVGNWAVVVCAGIILVLAAAVGRGRRTDGELR
ncbi:MAG TPA: apolipoprotein N-acyltransferase [Steroidobacteraceae bacterium]|nr:apolipoprotein N-acyltransferase [Steroidobacteraceae bacterium]HRX89041.1 apolipoprotein N-acyltransferase [Steroidobacteraceae bacterium]